MRAPLPPEVERRFQTGAVCLDFVHTGGIGAWMRHELVHGPDDLSLWLGYLLDLEPGAPVRCTERDVVAARELRESIWQMASARAADRPVDAVHVVTVNRFAASPPPSVQLDPTGTSLHSTPITGSGALALIARDAVELFGGRLGGRVRHCAAGNCELLFVDASRSGTRRWCSMEWCGNRSKVRAHRERERTR